MTLALFSIVRLLPLLLAATLATAGCSLGGRTLGRYYDDHAITRGVRHNLKTPGLSGVTVDTYAGTVYLTGTVQTEQQKSLAEIAARQMEGVEQVINDLRVRNDQAPSALPTVRTRNPLLDRLPGIVRVDPPPPDDPRGPSLAYDAAGRLVASVYTVPVRLLGQRPFEPAGTIRQPIDHVSIYPVGPAADRPDLECQVVLWHVSAADAALLRK